MKCLLQRIGQRRAWTVAGRRLGKCHRSSQLSQSIVLTLTLHAKGYDLLTQENVRCGRVFDAGCSARARMPSAPKWRGQ